MEGTFSANDQTRLKAFKLVTRLALVFAGLLPFCAYPQCSLSPAGWLENLSHIESTSAETGDKIRQLDELIGAHQACGLKKDSIYARIVHRLGDLYRINGNFEKGIQLTSEAIAINKQKTPGAQKSYLTHSYYNLGLYHGLLGLTADAHLYYDSCIENGSLFTEKLFIALMALEKKAFMHFQAGDYERSIIIADRGINLAQKHNLPEYNALLLIQKAQAETDLGRIREAQDHVGRAISILKEHQLDVYLPNAYSVYANILSRNRDFQQAIWHYQEAFRLNAAQQNAAQSARDLNDLGLLYDRSLNDDKRSITSYAKAIKVIQSLNDPYMLSATYNNMGQVYWRKGDFKNALKYYQQGLTSLPIAYTRHDVTEVPPMRLLKSVSNAYIPAALLWNKGDAWLGLYNLEQNEMFLKYALAAYRAGDRMVDLMRWRQQGEQSKLFWRQKTKRWYGKAIEAAYRLNDPEAVFYFMEKSRAVLLNDKLAELGAKNQLPPEATETEKRLKIRLQSISEKDVASGDGSNDALWQAQIDLNNFITQLEKSYPAYYAYKYDTAVFSLKDLQNHLIPEQAWIQLFTNNDTIFALTATSDAVRLHKISFAGHARIAKAISGLCSTKGSINREWQKFSDLSVQYYKNVFAPLNIISRRVTVSQDEYFIPFDLLRPDIQVENNFLLNHYAFSYAYSASHILRTANKKDIASNSLLAIAPVRYEAHLHLQDLEGADQSLKRIASFFSDGVSLTRSVATKQKFLSAISDYNIVHLYSHANADTTGREPAVYFYDSALNVSDLQNLDDLKTRLIVLFACNTGVGRSISGEGIFSLARGFATAGIPSTVSALWEIDSKATYHLAELFFRNLAEGQPSDIALQKAKLEMINNNDHVYRLPYFWAGTVLIGKPDIYPAVRSGLVNKTFMKVALTSGAVFIAVYILIAVIRRRNKMPV